MDYKQAALNYITTYDMQGNNIKHTSIVLGVPREISILFGVVEKDNFINSVICYARLYIMKCKIQDKQIAIEGFLNLIENEGVLYSI